MISLVAAAVISLRGGASTLRQFPEHGFSLTIPDGFAELTASRVPAGALAAYVAGDIQDGRAHSVITLKILDGLIGKDSHLTADQLPPSRPGFEFSVGRMRWNQHTIDSIEVAMTKNGTKLFSIAAQIPLAPKALQLTFAGPIEQMAAMSANAASVVASVTGQSNWDGPPGERVSPGKSIEGIVVSLIELAAVGALVILLYRKITGRRSA